MRVVSLVLASVVLRHDDEYVVVVVHISCREKREEEEEEEEYGREKEQNNDAGLDDGDCHPIVLVDFIMSSTFIFSTGIFMVKNFDRNNVKEDEAKAALRCGLLIASKPFFSAMSSYMWGRSGDRIGFKFNILVSVIFVAAINLAFGLYRRNDAAGVSSGV